MGCHTTFYIVYGVKVPEEITETIDFYEDERFLPMIVGRQNEHFTIVQDINGKYTVFGISIDSCEEYEEFEPRELQIGNMDSQKVKLKYQELFGAEPSSEPTLLLLSQRF
jgi:hypothetical protein